MDLIKLICNYYNDRREILKENHEKASHEIELLYSDLHDWIYEE